LSISTTWLQGCLMESSPQSTQQILVGEREIQTSEATVTPSPTLTPGWWDSPQLVPRQPEE